MRRSAGSVVGTIGAPPGAGGSEATHAVGHDDGYLAGGGVQLAHGGFDGSA